MDKFLPVECTALRCPTDYYHYRCCAFHSEHIRSPPGTGHTLHRWSIADYRSRATLEPASNVLPCATPTDLIAPTRPRQTGSLQSRKQSSRSRDASGKEVRPHVEELGTTR